MSNSYFQFKQFTLHHERCAMKIGTDGVLLGAWAPVDHVKSILDVGTGTGLIALQLAQRCKEASITAIELNEAAAAQAAENVASSPWAHRVEVVCGDFRTFEAQAPYDLIISNPPYFTSALRCPDAARTTARHADTLGLEILMRRAASMLAPQGRVSVVLPADAEHPALDAAWFSGLHPVQLTRVFTRADKPCKRLLLTFSTQEMPCSTQQLTLREADNSYSAAYRSLTAPFYLHF